MHTYSYIWHPLLTPRLIPSCDHTYLGHQNLNSLSLQLPQLHSFFLLAVNAKAFANSGATYTRSLTSLSYVHVFSPARSPSPTPMLAGTNCMLSVTRHGNELHPEEHGSQTHRVTSTTAIRIAGLGASLDDTWWNPHSAHTPPCGEFLCKPHSTRFHHLQSVCCLRTLCLKCQLHSTILSFCQLTRHAYSYHENLRGHGRSVHLTPSPHMCLKLLCWDLLYFLF